MLNTNLLVCTSKCSMYTNATELSHVITAAQITRVTLVFFRVTYMHLIDEKIIFQLASVNINTVNLTVYHPHTNRQSNDRLLKITYWCSVLIYTATAAHRTLMEKLIILLVFSQVISLIHPSIIYQHSSFAWSGEAGTPKTCFQFNSWSKIETKNHADPFAFMGVTNSPNLHIFGL